MAEDEMAKTQGSTRLSNLSMYDVVEGDQFTI